MTNKYIRRIQSEVRNRILRNRVRRIENLAAKGCLAEGSKEWFIHREIKYGGLHKRVPRRQVSLLDPRNDSERTVGMQGGDRMLHHGYARKYSEHLARIDRKERLVIAEFGILRGTGLAIWCDLFPKSRILGFDIDLSHMSDNLNDLIRRGAFSENRPELHHYDQFIYSEDLVGSILQGETIDVCIDDGCHLDEAIMCTMRSVMPHMSSSFLYFVEDNETAFRKVELEYPELDLEAAGNLTIVRRQGHSSLPGTREFDL